jgi:unsaturated rhamnogalacturonyl hydrolase
MKPKTWLSMIIVIFMVFLSCHPSCFLKDKNVFWQEESSPEKIGKLMTDDLLLRPDFMMYKSERVSSVHYAEACAGFGAARLAGLLGDKDRLEKLAARYRKVLDDSIPNTANHVDVNVYGILPLELYLQTKDEAFLKQGIELADGQWVNPLPDGLTNQTRFWIDDVWMIASLQVQAFRATGKTVYLDRAALEIDAYLKKLQQPNGLFHHGENSPFFWGRGNGWVAAGLAELLSVLPETNPHYAAIRDGYVKMMNALLRYQAEDGMWRQLIDHEEAWKETSSTAMFGYAMSVGVKKGFLPKSPFVHAYQKAWLALVKDVDKDGWIGEVCMGTGKGQDVPYYLARPRTAGDFHGQAPMLWFAWSLLAR